MLDIATTLASMNWSEFFADKGRLALILALGMPMVIAIVAVGGKVIVRRMELDLKRRMIERGFSAREIERVMATGGKDDDEDDEEHEETECEACGRPARAK